MENSDGVLAALDHQPVPFPRHAKAGILSPGRPYLNVSGSSRWLYTTSGRSSRTTPSAMGEGRSGRGKRVPLDQRKEGRQPVRCRTDGPLSTRWMAHGRGLPDRPFGVYTKPSPILAFQLPLDDHGKPRHTEECTLLRHAGSSKPIHCQAKLLAPHGAGLFALSVHRPTESGLGWFSKLRGL